MKCGYAKRKWWAFQDECDEWGGDSDVLAFIEWLYEKGYEIINQKPKVEYHRTIPYEP